MRVGVLLVVVGVVECGGEDSCRAGNRSTNFPDPSGEARAAFRKSTETVPGYTPAKYVLRGDPCRPLCRKVTANNEPPSITCSSDALTNDDKGNVTVVSWGATREDIEVDCEWACD